jgi:hypothetical protein
MNLKISRLIPAIFLVFAGAACDDHGDGEKNGNHNCPLSYSSGWGSYGLSFKHTEPQQCPISLSYRGQKIETGANILDGGERNFRSAVLEVYNSDNEQKQWTANGFFEGIDKRWETNVFASYAAGTGNPGSSLPGDDRTIFKMNEWLFGQSGTLPSSTLKVSYNTVVKTSMSGPTYPDTNAWTTWTADPSGGEGGYTYTWYRDWSDTPVSTDASYTGYSGETHFNLRVDVADGRGYSASYDIHVIPGHKDCTVDPSYPC